MTAYARAMLDAISLAGAEWELTHGRRCPDPEHGPTAPLLYRADRPVPPIPTCPSCGIERPVLIGRLIVVPDRE
jgi:hypothetical protein